MVATGVLLIDTITGTDVAEHPFELVTLTVYDPEADTLTDVVVCPPGDHK
jgi:hypothetical protein